MGPDKAISLHSLHISGDFEYVHFSSQDNEDPNDEATNQIGGQCSGDMGLRNTVCICLSVYFHDISEIELIFHQENMFYLTLSNYVDTVSESERHEFFASVGVSSIGQFSPEPGYRRAVTLG